MLKIYCLLFGIIFYFTSALIGQTRKINAGGMEITMSAVDTTLNNAFCSIGQMPEFPGGIKKMIAFAYNKIHYPKSAINDNIEGSVIVGFVINKNGEVTNKKILKSVRSDLDSVCLEMLNQMPNWKAGRLNGKLLAVNERWEIKFVLLD